jgi:CO/xanthine dehydrogenase FAD-binding subunit
MTAAPVPWRARTAEKLLEGSAPELAMLSAAAEAAASEINPTGDIHGGSSYRKALARTLCLQALTEAAATATPPNATEMDQ